MQPNLVLVKYPSLSVSLPFCVDLVVDHVVSEILLQVPRGRVDCRIVIYTAGPGLRDCSTGSALGAPDLRQLLWTGIPGRVRLARC